MPDAKCAQHIKITLAVLTAAACLLHKLIAGLPQCEASPVSRGFRGFEGVQRLHARHISIGFLIPIIIISWSGAGRE